MDTINKLITNTILKRIGIEKIGHQLVILRSIENLIIKKILKQNEMICDNEPLIPSWKCPKCGNKNNMQFIECQICKQSLNNADQKMLKQLNGSKCSYNFLKFKRIYH